jgi:hypothetical protein
MPSNVLVSGLTNQSANANGLYIQNGEFAEKAAYFLNGTDISNSQSFIVWNGSIWAIEEFEIGSVYTSDQDVAYPWLVTNWINVGPESDPPTVIEIPSQNTFGLPAESVALITSRFGTVANYLRLRNQGQV